MQSNARHCRWGDLGPGREELGLCFSRTSLWPVLRSAGGSGRETSRRGWSPLIPAPISVCSSTRISLEGLDLSPIWVGFLSLSPEALISTADVLSSACEGGV